PPLRAQSCPFSPGTYVAEECKEQNGSGTCVPCEDEEYTEYPNDFRQCQNCGKCREDQVEVSACQPVRNTVCACRNGSFCPPEHPCEMCQKCQPRCPEGQVVLKPCTPYSDLQCGPAADSSSAYLWAFLSAVITGTAIALVLCAWWCHRRSPGGCRAAPELPGALCRCGLGGKRVQPGARGITALFLSCRGWETPEQEALRNGGVTLSFQVMQPSENERPKRNLVPAPGNDPIKVLRRSFYVFARKISRDDWRKFGRSLDLEENDIVLEWTDEAFYQMLSKWLNREGTKSSVNTLLETLARLRLGGVAEDISSTLVQSGLFQYETS
ncbi:TR10B factor, partial [Dryoscopus gambensis]|nr:TR10B factor [Dryoscopus gambensis]